MRMVVVQGVRQSKVNAGGVATTSSAGPTQPVVNVSRPSEAKPPQVGD
jgi:hypothetical protein